MTISPYQREQLETLDLVDCQIQALAPLEKERLKALCSGYLQFLHDVDNFLLCHFEAVCTVQCYQSRLSACCSREGIITFFADVVINVLFSEPARIQTLKSVLQNPGKAFKCIYLGDDGCLWHVKPIVCKMFLCDRARDAVFIGNIEYREAWENLEQRRKRFTWPDRPVLFDDLERYFIEAGCRSPLMYLHNSPGLLRVKKKSREGAVRTAASLRPADRGGLSGNASTCMGRAGKS